MQQRWGSDYLITNMIREALITVPFQTPQLVTNPNEHRRYTFIAIDGPETINQEDVIALKPDDGGYRGLVCVPALEGTAFISRGGEFGYTQSDPYSSYRDGEQLSLGTSFWFSPLNDRRIEDPRLFLARIGSRTLTSQEISSRENLLASAINKHIGLAFGDVSPEMAVKFMAEAHRAICASYAEEMGIPEIWYARSPNEKRLYYAKPHVDEVTDTTLLNTTKPICDDRSRFTVIQLRNHLEGEEIVGHDTVLPCPKTFTEEPPGRPTNIPTSRSS